MSKDGGKVMTLEQRLESTVGRVLTLGEKEFVRHMRMAAERDIPYSWMYEVIRLEWDDKEDAPLARVDFEQQLKIANEIIAFLPSKIDYMETRAELHSL